MADAQRRTIPTLVRAAVEAVPDRIWLRTEGEELTYDEAQGRIEAAASGLRSAGVGRGDRVLVTARGEARYLLLWLALMEVGAVQVPVNPQSTAAELRGFIDQVAPAAVVSDTGSGRTVAAALGDAGRLLDVDRLFAAERDGVGPAAVEESDLAVMIPTSGTTGRSKLVMQTHLAYVMAGEGFPYWMQLTSDDRLMTSLPLFHINAPAYSTLGSIAARASLVLLDGFSARDFIDASRRHGATEFNSIGAMLEILMRQPVRDDDADNPLRLCYTGPSPDRQRHLEIEARFGLEIVCGYALSETPYGLMWRRGTRPFGSLGSARQHPTLGTVNEARVMDGENTVDPGQVGELELRNPVIMRGYYEMPDETAAVRHGDWLRTGDLVHVDADDLYTFVGRQKEVIRRRGENLSPAEVEAALERHPSVAEAAVVGVPSDLSEEDVKAFVVAAPGQTVDPVELHAFAGQQLARFKVPRYVEVVGELPRTATNRLAKHRLPTERTPTEVDFDAPAELVTVDDPGSEWLHSWIGSSTRDHIRLAGRDLPGEIMGRLSLTELAFLLITRREATAGERRLLDAVLVSLADHGLTPSALATRLTYTGAPESVQGAVAAGLLGAGSVFLGPAGDTAQFLADALAEPLGRSPDTAASADPAPRIDDDALRAIAGGAVDDCRRANRRVPGLGHPVHRDQDPRTARLYELADEEGRLGPHLRLLALIAEAHERETGRHLPINGAGAGGALLVDVGLPPSSVRGFVLIARTAGLVAHLVEEADEPLGMPLWLEVEARANPDTAS